MTVLASLADALASGEVSVVDPAPVRDDRSCASALEIADG
jgi:hypothetical protein